MTDRMIKDYLLSDIKRIFNRVEQIVLTYYYLMEILLDDWD